MRKHDILIFIVLLLVPVLFFYKTFLLGLFPFPGDLLVSEYNPWKTYSYLGYNPGSYPNKAQYFDVLRQLYPWKTLIISQFFNNAFPLWNPYNFSGTPLLANFQSAAFYPLNIVYIFFSQKIAWTILVILQPIIAMLGTYFYSRKIGLSTIASFFSSTTFAFSSFMNVWLEYNTIGHVVAWMPVLFLAFEHLLERKTRVWILLFVAAIVFQIFSGHPQLFMYSFFFLLIYGFFRMYKGSFFIHESIFFMILILFSLGIAAVQLIPGLELIQNSARSSHDFNFLFNKILIQPYQIIMLVSSDFFGNPATRNYFLQDTYVGKTLSVGIIPLLFILFRVRNIKTFFVTFFGLSAICILLFVTANPVTFILYSLRLPMLSASAPTLSLFIFCFCLSMLCGFGVDSFIARKEKTVSLLKLLSPVILLFVIGWIFYIFASHDSQWYVYRRVIFRNFIYDSIIAFFAISLLVCAVWKKQFRKCVLIVLLLLHVGYLFRSFNKFNPFVSEELVFPKAELFDVVRNLAGQNRFWGYKSAQIEANFATGNGLYSPDGYDPLYPKRYGEFIQSATDGKIRDSFDRTTRSDAVLKSSDGLQSRYFLRVADMLGVRLFLDRKENGSSEKDFPSNRFEEKYKKDGWTIFENSKAAPRAFLTSTYGLYANTRQFEQQFFSPSFDVSTRVLLEKRPTFESQENPVGKNAHQLDLVQYSENSIKFITQTKIPSILFLSDVYYPGWKVLIDGVSKEIVRSNYAFRSVEIPVGTHAVIFMYDPNSFKYGFIVSIISVFATGLFIFFHPGKKR